MITTPSYCPFDFWTIAATTDELIFQLSSAYSFTINDDTKEIHIMHKYYEQAEYILYRINIYNPRPVFVINRSDLASRLQSELKRLFRSSREAFDKIVTEAVEVILESVNRRYYHLNGIKGKIRWRFDP